MKEDNKKYPAWMSVEDIIRIQENRQRFIEETARVADPPLYWFREHRGGLEESLKTAFCCHCGLDSIVEYFKHMNHPNPCPYTNIHIQDKVIIDKRLPIWWGEKEYPVVASSNEDDHDCIITLGYCNFK